MTPDDQHDLASPPSGGDGGLIDDLSTAAARGELFALFQPQVDVLTGRIVAAEALVRWRHPTRGEILPDDFIPLAEQSGAIHGIGAFMLDAASTYARDIAARGDDIEIAVNVSAEQLRTSAFVEHLERNIVEFGLAPGSITVELTESRQIVDLREAVSTLRRVRRTGMAVSLDDFGVGHTSFEQLDQLPVTEMKLDRSVLRDETPEGATLMTALVALGVARGLCVVIEGVETERDLARVRAIECHRAQGYYLGRPMTRESLDERLTAA